MNADLQFVEELACSAGDLLASYYRPEGTPYKLKHDQSVVTEADIAADDLIAEAIRAAYPDDLILSEEVQPFLSPDHRGNTWVVDPLDGTTNFSLGLPIWGVAIVKAIDGMPHTAAMYFPLIHEMYTAQAGAGAYLNGDRIHVRPPESGPATTFFACCGHTHRQYNVSVPYKPRILGSAVYDFCSVARGAALLCFEATSKLWDIAAPWILVQEAGGFIQAHHGQSPFPLPLNVRDSSQAYPTLSAASEKLLIKGRSWIQLKEA
jgi:myo-inositol-1(or 4)-monophosphatase